MSNNLAISDLTTLAIQINQEHVNGEAAFKAGIQHALRAGELLLQAKALCPHGEWGQWLKDNCSFSERTAQAYMRVARELPGLTSEKAQRVADLSFRETLALLAEPKEDNPEQFRPEVLKLTAELEAMGPKIKSDGAEIIYQFKQIEGVLTPDQFKSWLATEHKLTMDEYRTAIQQLENPDWHKVIEAMGTLSLWTRPFFKPPPDEQENNGQS